MTRKEVGEQYTIVQGHIRSPGKFEGEELFIPHFWDAGLNGLADDETSDDDDGPPVWVFTVTDDDRREFPELEHVKTIRLWEDDSGFVRSDY